MHAIANAREVACAVRDQVKRLMHHASVAVWSGNNENEQAITQNWFTQTRTDPYTYAVRAPAGARMRRPSSASRSPLTDQPVER